MRLIILVLVSCFCSFASNAEMVESTTLGNDPVKERLCESRANMGKTVPFFIDSRYVENVRRSRPDVTFIAVDRGQLIECALNAGSGEYGPASFSPEQSFWHLVKPEQFKPGMNTDEGRAMAARACLEAIPDKINRPNFHHIVHTSITEAGVTIGKLVGAARVERYDILVTGRSFYSQGAGPDLASVEFTCLMSPMLAMKGIQVKK